MRQRVDRLGMALNIRFGIGFSILFLGRLNLPSNDVLPDVVFLGKVEEPPDFSSSLGAEPLGKNIVGQAFHLAFPLFHNNQGENSNIGADNATTDRLAFALTVPAGTVAGVTVGEEESDTVGEENTLLHGETLLVVSTSDTEDISSPLGTQSVGFDFLRDPFVVEDTTAFQSD